MKKVILMAVVLVMICFSASAQNQGMSINMEEIASEQVYTSTIAKRDTQILLLAQEVKKLQKENEELKAKVKEQEEEKK